MAAPNIKIEGHVECTIFPRGGRNCISLEGVLYELVDYFPDPENLANRFRLAKTPNGYYSVSYREPEKVCKSKDAAMLASHSVEQVASKFIRAQSSLVELARKFNIPVEEMNSNLELLQGILDDAVAGVHDSHDRIQMAPVSRASEIAQEKGVGKGDIGGAGQKSVDESSETHVLMSGLWKNDCLRFDFEHPALHVAAFAGSEHAYEYLVAQTRHTPGLREFALPCFGAWDTTSSLAHCAAASNNAVLLKSVLTHAGGAETLTEGGFPVSFAAAYGGADSLRALLAHAPAALTAKSTNQPELSIMHCAAMGGNIEGVKFLMSRGLPLNKPDRFNLEPVHYAAARGHVDLVSWFVDREPALLTERKKKLSLFLASATAKNPATMKFLATRTNIHAKDHFGASAIHYAAAAGRTENVEILKKLGVSTASTPDNVAPNQLGLILRPYTDHFPSHEEFEDDMMDPLMGIINHHSACIKWFVDTRGLHICTPPKRPSRQ